MSCTTYRKEFKESLEDVAWNAYCHFMHTQRIKQMKPAVEWGRDSDVRVERKKKKFNASDYQRRTQIAMENRLLTQRLLSTAMRKPIYGQNQSDAHKRILANRLIARENRKEYKLSELQKQNFAFCKRLKKTRATINTKKMLEQDERRQKFLTKLQKDYQRKLKQMNDYKSLVDKFIAEKKERTRVLTAREDVKLPLLTQVESQAAIEAPHTDRQLTKETSENNGIVGQEGFQLRPTPPKEKRTDDTLARPVVGYVVPSAKELGMGE